MSRNRQVRVRRSKRRTVALFLALVAASALLLAGLYTLGRWLENRDDHEERQQMSEGFGQLPTVEYQGAVYVKRPEVTTVLIMGVDRTSETEPSGYRSGGQADFLLLLAMDHKAHTVSQLQIDRDAITDVPVVGVLGNDAGTRRMQICLSHAYGRSEEERAKHTMEAVANLLCGETAEICYSVRLDAIGAVNSLLGGVTVTVPLDLSAQDPAMTEGATVTLTDEQAELLVRTRIGIGDGTNEQRMARQRVFMTAALDAMTRKMGEDAEFASRLFDTLDSASGYTNVPRGRWINEINRTHSYDILPAETLTGEYKIGEDGFMEFHADEDAVAVWVLRNLYEPKK